MTESVAFSSVRRALDSIRSGMLKYGLIVLVLSVIVVTQFVDFLPSNPDSELGAVVSTNNNEPLKSDRRASPPPPPPHATLPMWSRSCSRPTSEQRRWFAASEALLQRVTHRPTEVHDTCERHLNSDVTYFTNSRQRSVVRIVEPGVYEVSMVCLGQNDRIYYIPTTKGQKTSVQFMNEIKQAIKLKIAPLQPSKHRVFQTGVVHLMRWERHYHKNLWHSLYRWTPLLNFLERTGHNNKTRRPRTEIVHVISPDSTSFLPESHPNFMRHISDIVAPPTRHCHSVHAYYPTPAVESNVNASSNTSSSNTTSSNTSPPLPQHQSMRCFSRVFIGWPPFYAHKHGRDFSSIRRRFMEYLNLRPPVPGSPRILTLIDRRHAIRKVHNIKEIALSLDAMLHGSNWVVRTVDFGNLTFREQAQVAADTKLMVGITGAGLTWQFMMQPGGATVEICPGRYSGKRHVGNQCTFSGWGLNRNKDSWYGRSSTPGRRPRTSMWIT
eukprot:PhM_4_TR3191/c0_g1_i3/m.8018